MLYHRLSRRFRQKTCRRYAALLGLFGGDSSRRAGEAEAIRRLPGPHPLPPRQDGAQIRHRQGAQEGAQGRQRPLHPLLRRAATHQRRGGAAAFRGQSLQRDAPGAL